MVYNAKKSVRRKSRRAYRKNNLKKIIKYELRKNIENKYIPYAASAFINNLGTFFDITLNLTQGVQGYQRVGNEIRLQKLLLRSQVQGADAFNVLRYIVGYAKSPMNVSQCYSAINNVYNGIWDQTRFPCYMLMDKMVTVGPLNGQNLPPVQLVNVRKSLKNWATHYESNNSGLVRQGQLFIFVISDSSVLTHPQFDFQCNITFQDA